MLLVGLFCKHFVFVTFSGFSSRAIATKVWFRNVSEALGRCICIQFHSIPFYSIPFYSILFYSIPFYSIPFYSILFYSTPLCSTLLYSTSTLLYSTPLW